MAGSVRAALPDDVLDEGERSWTSSIVAQFAGRVPNFSAFQKQANLLWGKEGNVDIRSAGKNLFIIQFPNVNVRDWVLESGPWHIQHQPLIVRKWEEGMDSLDFNMARLLVWVNLYNVPLEAFSKKGLSYIASVLAQYKPLHKGKKPVMVVNAEKTPAVRSVASSSQTIGKGSVNRFEILQASLDNDVVERVEEGTEEVLPLRQIRASSMGVKELMKELKPGRKRAVRRGSQYNIVDRIRSNKVGYVSLLETRVKVHKCKDIVDKHFQGWNFVNNYSDASNGRIWMLWKDPYSATVVAVMDQCITCLVECMGKRFYASSVYASNFSTDRRRLWKHLEDMSVLVDKGSWIISGDFNVLLHPSESSNYSGISVLSADMKDFAQCVENIGVIDHVYMGLLLHGLIIKRLIFKPGSWIEF
ncbi:hypothetical protein PTKIN_Ptkin08bG0084500 [Pterospermum kingtungense]